MSEGLTPERRAEIEGIRSHLATQCGTREVVGAFTQLLAEIDRLNKVVDQAIECARSWHVIYSATRHPELAAELQRRGK